MLTANKEIAKKVASAIEESASESDNSKYTFDAFCTDHNLYRDNDKRLSDGELLIGCPFHADKTPSFGFSEHKRSFHCFSCDRSGKYLDLLLMYAREIEGRDITYYQLLNEMLTADPDLRQRVGETSVFVQERPQDTFTGAQYRKFKIQRALPKTYPELATSILRKKLPEQDVILAMLQMQSGLSPDIIYESVVNKKFSAGGAQKSSTNSYDINEMMKEDSEPKAITAFEEK